jgi:hypothetical protein
MDILDSQTFKRVMYFKFFMVIVVWGLIPLLIPENLLPPFGLYLTSFQIMLLRIWGVIVLLDFFLYVYIFKNRHKKLSKYLILFGVLDNGGVGLILLVLTFIYNYSWGIWANIPFQLFFGYWFLRFYREGKFT